MVFLRHTKMDLLKDLDGNNVIKLLLWHTILLFQVSIHTIPIISDFGAQSQETLLILINSTQVITMVLFMRDKWLKLLLVACIQMIVLMKERNWDWNNNISSHQHPSMILSEDINWNIMTDLLLSLIRIKFNWMILIQLLPQLNFWEF